MVQWIYLEQLQERFPVEGQPPALSFQPYGAFEPGV